MLAYVGGVIVMKSDSRESAREMASTKPSLRIYPGDRVEVMPGRRKVRRRE